MSTLKYELENYRGMAIYNKCPGCKSDKTFQRYISITTGVQIANEVGECNSKNCGYCYPAHQYFKENNMHYTHILTPSFIADGDFLKSLSNYEGNNLFLYLSKLFGVDKAKEAISLYSIGTSRAYPGAAVLWFIDGKDKKRTGRIALIDAETGKESRPDGCKGWVHRYMEGARFNLITCLFGEHLLKKEQSKPVVIVESDMAAIVASCLYPEYLWLAMCDGFTAPNRSAVLALSGRTVTWFPSSGFERLKGYGILYPH